MKQGPQPYPSIRPIQAKDMFRHKNDLLSHELKKKKKLQFTF